MVLENTSFEEDQNTTPLAQCQAYHDALLARVREKKKHSLVFKQSLTLTGIPREVWRNFKCHCVQQKSTPGKSLTRPNSLHLPAISGDYVVVGQRFIVIDKTAILGYPGMHHIQEFIS